MKPKKKMKPPALVIEDDPAKVVIPDNPEDTDGIAIALNRMAYLDLGRLRGWIQKHVNNLHGECIQLNILLDKITKLYSYAREHSIPFHRREAINHLEGASSDIEAFIDELANPNCKDLDHGYVREAEQNIEEARKILEEGGEG